MKIVVLDGYTLNPGDLSWENIQELGELTVYDRTPSHMVAERAEGAEILLTNKAPVSAEALDRLKSLRFISVLATGYDIIDVQRASEVGIPVSNVPEYGTDSVAQFTLALLLELCHHVGRHNDLVKNGEWTDNPDWCFWKSPQILLKDRKIGIVGLGRIGCRVAELAHALGMEILAYNPSPKKGPVSFPFLWRSLEELFSESHAVTLHCPQSKDNKGFVDAHLIRSMKKEAFLINASRGGPINEEDLASALQERKIAGAAVDVVSSEPVSSNNPLLKAPNCLITPHMAWATPEARLNLMEATEKNIKAYLAGSPINVVNRTA